MEKKKDRSWLFSLLGLAWLVPILGPYWTIIIRRNPKGKAVLENIGPWLLNHFELVGICATAIFIIIFLAIITRKS